MVDDSGLFTDGTPVDKAFMDAVMDETDDQCHSTTNPTVKPKAITDEVIAARGNLADLDTRISAVVDEDGNPVAAAGQATETQVALEEGNVNLVLNSDLETWTAGTTSAPDNYTLAGAGAAILKSGPAQADTTDLGAGTYCARVTSGAGAAATLKQEIISAAEMSRYRAIRGRKVGFTIRGKASVASALRIVVDDGAVQTASTYHAGDGQEAYLTVVHPISGSATKLDVYAEVALGANVAYVGGFTVVFSALAPAAWTPGWDRYRAAILEDSVPSQADLNDLGTTTIVIGGRLSTNVTPVGNVGGGEDNLMTYAVPAGLLASTGQALRVTCWGTFGATGAVKRIRAYFGATGIEVCSVAGFSPNAGSWRAVFRVIRTGAATQIISGEGWTRDGAGASNVFAPADGTPAETLANSITLKLTGEATSNDDISQMGMIVEAVL